MINKNFTVNSNKDKNILKIISDKVILDHKKSYFVSFENFHFFRFLAKIVRVKVKKSQEMKIFKIDLMLLFIA